MRAFSRSLWSRFRSYRDRFFRWRGPTVEQRVTAFAAQRVVAEK